MTKMDTKDGENKGRRQWFIKQNGDGTRDKEHSRHRGGTAAGTCQYECAHINNNTLGWN